MKHSLILFILTLFIAGCSKPYIPCSDDDPDCFYFVCKVDGEVFRPQCESDDILFGGCSAVDVRYYQPFDLKDLYIYIDNEEKDQSIKISSSNIKESKSSYALFSAPRKRYMTTFYKGAAECNKNYIDTNSIKDRLYITEIDIINNVIDGEFNFTAFNECTSDPIEVTEGKFRLKYRY